jgi:hypothetical protein
MEIKAKYLIYFFSFIFLISILTLDESISRNHKQKYDTVNIYFDKINEEFYIDKYEVIGNHRERTIKYNQIIFVDRTEKEIKIKLCKEKTDICQENKMKNIYQKAYITQGLYRLKINTLDEYPVKKQSFYLYGVNLE